MTTPPTKPDADLVPQDDDLLDRDEPFLEPTLEDIAREDAWFERNRDALIKSFRKADEDFATGNFFSHEEVWARVRATIKKYARKP